MYCASGALFSTMETVAGENPLDVATSRMVTLVPLPPARFTVPSLWPASSGISGSDCNLGLILVPGRLFRGRLKRKLLAETFRLPNAECHTERHPDCSQDLRSPAQVPPKPQANEETDKRHEEVECRFLRSMNEIPHKRRCIHSHKRNQRAKVQQSNALFVGQKKRSD